MRPRRARLSPDEGTGYQVKGETLDISAPIRRVSEVEFWPLTAEQLITNMRPISVAHSVIFRESQFALHRPCVW